MQFFLFFYQVLKFIVKSTYIGSLALLRVSYGRDKLKVYLF